ncbi:MAG: AraC family transcriptional regulator [Balneolaceae bacterium]|nr:AraC family transcriptional regulator [Balneolaceae bacterium]
MSSEATGTLLVRRALVFIINHLFAPKLTVGWMKQQCRINGNNFSGKFKYHLDQTPKQYILFHRMEVAKQLLSKVDLADVPISAIAFELGFSSAAVFSNAFKSRMGESPSRWRKRGG